MSLLLLGNILGLIGSAVMVFLGFIKKPRTFVLVQSVQAAIMTAANFVLGGISGVVINVLSLIRNLICYKWKLSVPLKLVFIALQILIPAFMGGGGLVFWLPVLAGCSLTWFLDTENALLLKIVVEIGQVLWGVYDLSISNYTTFVFDVIAVISNAYSLFVITRNKTKGEKEE